jgi:hypothetical protein
MRKNGCAITNQSKGNGVWKVQLRKQMYVKIFVKPKIFTYYYE